MNWQFGRWKLGVRTFAVVGSLALLATACSNAGSSKANSNTNTGGTVTTFTGTNFTENDPVNAPGVSSTEIHVASVTSKTNPIGGDNVLLNDGIKAYFDTINSKGGIYGRQLKLTSERDDATVNNANQVQAMLTQDNAYAAFIATELFTGSKALAAAGMPTFGWNIQAEWAGPKNFFPNVAPICFSGCALQPHLVTWLMEQSHAHRVAIIGYSVPQSASCVTGNVANVNRFGPNVGAKVVYSDATLSFGQTDFSAQVSKMKDAHADFLVTCMDFNGDYSVAKEMNLQGIRNSVTFYHANLYNRAFVQANGKLFEGDLVLAQITAVEHKPAIPAVQAYLDYASAHPNFKVTELTMQGWIAAKEFVDALKATGPHFTWANLVNAWNQQKWYSADGWIIPVDWTRQHTDPAKGVQYQSDFDCANIVKIHDSAFVPVFDGGGSKPWICWDGHKPTVWSEPVNVSFAGQPFTFAQAKSQG